MKTRSLVFIISVLVIIVLTSASVVADEPSPICDPNRSYPYNDHLVCEQFLDFFNAQGGLEIFGYPLTDWYYENGRLVQYFQRGRMEYHPENPERYQVQMGLLGDYFAPADKKARIPASERPKSNDPERRYFPETGHTASFSFLQFFNEKGGLDNFGYPVTELILENGRFVQYFQRAMMEWDPNLGSIVLHDLGRMWMEAQSISPPGQSGRFIPGSDNVLSISATVSVSDAFTGHSGKQTVWVYVYDANGNPLPGATVTVTVRYPDKPDRLPAGTTDENGLFMQDFELKIDESNRGKFVVLEAVVTYVDSRNRAETKTHTSFYPWW